MITLYIYDLARNLVEETAEQGRMTYWKYTLSGEVTEVLKSVKEVILPVTETLRLVREVVSLVEENLSMKKKQFPKKFAKWYTITMPDGSTLENYYDAEYLSRNSREWQGKKFLILSWRITITGRIENKYTSRNRIEERK